MSEPLELSASQEAEMSEMVEACKKLEAEMTKFVSTHHRCAGWRNVILARQDIIRSSMRLEGTLIAYKHQEGN